MESDPIVGTLVRHADFPSRLVTPRHVDVWLPPGYDAESGPSMPVIYAHDGQNLFSPETAYGGVDWGIDETLVRLIDAGEVPPAIVVGIWNTEHRWREYMPQRALDEAAPDVRRRFVEAHGGPPFSDTYLRFVVTELKPFVDRSYRTLPEPLSTFIMGSSMGGLISLYALGEYPEIFSAAACVSTHWPAGDGCVVDYVRGRLPAPGAHRIYFDYGTQTLDALYEPYQQQVDAIVAAAGYEEGKDWVTRAFPGAEHSERSWRERAGVPLRFLLEELIR